MVGALTLGIAALLPGQFKRYDPAEQIEPLPSDGSDETDPADAQHGVARISFLSGEVNVQRGQAGPVAAALNAPVVATDRIQTGPRAAAEIEVDSETVIRVAENSDVGFAALDANGFQLQVSAGTVVYRVLRSGTLAGELETPNVAIRAPGATDLRVSILSDGTTLVQLRSGEADLMGPAGSDKLTAGRAYIVRGNPADPEFQESALAPPDGFDGWSQSRDAAALNAQSAQYLPPGASGAADLDANGSWVPSEYGQVWTPSGVDANWTPYSNGFWTYENYYGWTWVDHSSWGWAPYHYGRWFRNANYGWCWWPGPRVVRSPWRPAVVGFYGWGGGYRGLGWVPLAPHERFRSWWGGNGGRPLGYGGGNYAPSYRNAYYRGAVTFASYQNFAGPGQRFSHLSREQLRGAAPLNGRIPVTPVRSNYSFSQRQAFAGIAASPMRSFAQAPQSRNPSRSFSTPSGNPWRTSPSYSQWSRVGSVRAPLTLPRSTFVPSFDVSGGDKRSERSNDSRWGRFGDPGRARGNAGDNNFGRQSFRGESGRSNENGWHQFGRPASPSRDSNRGSAPRGGKNNGNSGGRSRR